MRTLITGGTGFIGSNLARAVLEAGGELTVLDNLSRRGSEQNLAWLRSSGEFRFLRADVRNPDDVALAVREARPEVVFHLAGQVAMTTSLEDPRLDFETNVGGGFNVLEAVRRHAPEAVLTYSSSNKVYGALASVEIEATPTRWVAKGWDQGFDESLPLDFRTPYGCSKGAMDQYMLDWARMYGLRTIVFRHSSVFGGRQFATYDQGWVGWFVGCALEIAAGRATEPFTISGDGRQVRDLLYVDDLVSCYFAAVGHAGAACGRAFNIGGGPDNAFSLLELFAFLEAELGIEMRYRRLPERREDQRVFVSDPRAARACFGWAPSIGREEGVRRMIAWCRESPAERG
jgi:CDP-paratose 2-epimerase